jgi:hypothetical protein
MATYSSTQLHFQMPPVGEGLPTQAIAERDDYHRLCTALCCRRQKSVSGQFDGARYGAGPRVKPVTLAAAFNAFNDAKTAYNGNIFYVELASLLFSIE